MTEQTPQYVTTDEVAVVHDAHTDAGDTFEFCCPHCRDRVIWSKYGWGGAPTCGCGYRWRIVLYAEGVR